MEIKLLKDSYIKGESVYSDFINNRISDNDDNFDEVVVNIDDIPDFPVYINVSEEERAPLFIEAIRTLGNYYLDIDREYTIEGQFWYSLFLVYKRDYLINKYPKILENEKHFRNIVLKKFDWENYVYKCVLIAQYVNDNISDEAERERYYGIIVNNLDLFNYIIKYRVFRNDKFLLNIMDIVSDNNLSEILKAKLKDRPDLGEDSRIGRRVIFELNKSYPVILAPTLEKDELEVLFMENLRKYV